MHYLSFASAFIATVICMIALRPLAIKMGMVDKPGGRKTHYGDIPIVGGVAMFIGFALAMILIPDLDAPFQYLALSCGVLALIGILDDCFDLPALLRLVAQILVVLIMSYGDGLIIRDIGNTFGLGVVSFGSFSWLFTMLIVVTVINAFNLVDGVDGLAGSLALVAFICIAIVATVGSMAFQVSIIAIVTVVAFLLFNYPMKINKPLSAFMGDGGSTMLGLLIAWVIISISHGDTRIVTPVVALWFASVPVYDLFTSFVRRMLQGKSPFVADREHFHHILIDGGMGVRQTLGILTALQAVYAVIGLAGHFAGIPDAVMFAGWAILGVSQFAIVTKLLAIFPASSLSRSDSQPQP